MSETLATRVKRLVSGSAHMLVAAVENLAPEAVMEEAIREVGRAIDDVRGELGRVMTRQYHAGRRLAEENRRHEELSESVKVALSQGREDLAEAGVAQLLDIEAQIPVLEASLAEAKQAQNELEGYIAALQARKREMEEELRQFRQSREAAEIHARANGGVADGGAQVHHAVQNAGAAFQRAMESAGGVALPRGASDPKAAALNAELEELARRNRIRERLAALRKDV